MFDVFGIVLLARRPVVGAAAQNNADIDIDVGRVVETDSDVRAADEIGDIAYVPRHGLDADIVIAEKDAHAVEADDAAGSGAGANLFIVDVALMRPDCGGIGM